MTLGNVNDMSGVALSRRIDTPETSRTMVYLEGVPQPDSIDGYESECPNRHKSLISIGCEPRVTWAIPTRRAKDRVDIAKPTIRR